MIAPTRTSFSGWKLVGGSPYSSYPAGSSYYVYNSDKTFIAQWEPWAPQGISIGIISFAGDARNITGQGDSNFYFLDDSGKQSLASSLYSYSLASEPGTALYYAVHKALANLTKAEPTFSNDTIHSINLITFTDGLDNASFGASNNASIEGKSGVSSTEYAAYVKEQIGSRTIGGKPISAYSIGVKGSDVTDENAFNTSLSSIASTEGNVHTLTNVSELEEKLAEIAGSIDINIIESKVNNFRMQTTQNDPGTVIRMTFDVTGTNPADAAASTRYIEGTLAYNKVTERWSLTNIQYSSGISSDSGASIGGVASGSTVSFTFKNILGYDPQSDTAKQWFKSSDLWQINSEYSASGSTETTVNMDTMLVYLVLDASTSLNTEQIGQIRTAVNGFITTLYDRTHPQD
jgi:hypothetical protein